MKKFNTSDLLTGYIKQLLHDFNLPKIKVYTEQHQRYFDQYGRESAEILGTLKATPSDTVPKKVEDQLNVRYFPYIKNGEIQEYINKEWVCIGDRVTNNIEWNMPRNYTYGEKILNYTKNLKLNSNVYDSYTHEYLGDYLRFHRDFLGLDLMSLYNCFSNRSCDKLNFNWTAAAGNTISFNTSDTNYKIYMIPVKLFKKYTIAVDSEAPIEMCCGIYGDYQDSRAKFKDIPRYTYKKVSPSIFSQPFLYDLLAYTNDAQTNTLLERLEPETKIELAQNEADLKLFLKLPVENNSTVVILEGDYLNWADSIWTGQINQTNNTWEWLDKQMNRSIINLEYSDADNFGRVKLVSTPQLLQFNTGEQHPFADRLIEYLTGNAITNSETEIYDNVRRAQKALESNYRANNYVIDIPGLWDSKMNTLFYEYITSKITSNKFQIQRDLLGYVDKDVEKYYQATTVEHKYSPKTGAMEKVKANISLSNIELEEEDK